MKKFNVIVLCLTAAAAFVGCSKDNYDAPETRLEGRVTFRGEPLGLAHGAVQLQLYQDGFGEQKALPVYVSADGTFRSLLFDGKYMLSVPDGAGPWRPGVVPLTLEVSGTTSVDLEVVPYYVIRNPQILLGGSTLKATCTVERISEGASVQYLSLFIGATRFVDGRTGHNLSRMNFTSVREGENSLTQNVGSLSASHDELWARIGLQIDGVSELLYGPAVKIK